MACNSPAAGLVRGCMVPAGAIIMIWPLGVLTAVPRLVDVPAGIPGADAGIPVSVAGRMPEEVVMMPTVLPGIRFWPMEDGSTCNREMSRK